MAKKSKRDRKAKTKQAASLAAMIRRFKDGHDDYNSAARKDQTEAEDQRLYKKMIVAPAGELDKTRPAAKNLEDVLVAIDFVLCSVQFDPDFRKQFQFHRIE